MGTVFVLCNAPSDGCKIPTVDDSSFRVVKHFEGTWLGPGRNEIDGKCKMLLQRRRGKASVSKASVRLGVSAACDANLSAENVCCCITTAVSGSSQLSFLK